MNNLKGEKPHNYISMSITERAGGRRSYDLSSTFSCFQKNRTAITTTREHVSTVWSSKSCCQSIPITIRAASMNLQGRTHNRYENSIDRLKETGHGESVRIQIDKRK